MGSDSIIKFVSQTAASLFPGYFSLVMATGALSIAAFLLNMTLISYMLLYINIVAYLVLWGLTLFRLVRHFSLLMNDLTSHRQGPGFFTLIAGTCVFGSQLIVVAGNYSLAVFYGFYLSFCGS